MEIYHVTVAEAEDRVRRREMIAAVTPQGCCRVFGCFFFRKNSILHPRASKQFEKNGTLKKKSLAAQNSILESFSDLDVPLIIIFLSTLLLLYFP